MAKNYYDIIKTEYLKKKENDKKSYNFEEYEFHNDYSNSSDAKILVENNFFSIILLDLLNTIKYNKFNSKIILYCHGKFNEVMDIKNNINVENLSYEFHKNIILKVLEQFARFNEQKLISLVFKRLHFFSSDCHEMKEYSQKDILSYIRILMEPLENFDNEDFEIFKYQ